MEKEHLDFKSDVLTRSHEVPVLVDFWSPTCGPCLVLGPVLDKLASEAEGKWELIKVNTMFNQQLAADYNIMSIPAVKLFYKGQVINEFVGALPEPTLRKWLDEFIPTEAKIKLSAILKELQQDKTGGLANLEAFVVEHPEVPLGHLALGSELLWTDTERGMEYLGNVDQGSLLFPNAANMKILGEMLLFEDDQSGEAATILADATQALKEQDFTGAVSNVVAAVEADPIVANDLGKRGGQALFNLLGARHPLTAKYRQRFTEALG